ncbi:spermatogenesis-associated protein 31D1-like [Apodemus sylvaticus]|uniref:spermatogenesis-associated protein 31D1-like n=1 Tax=Apodemus sylvaticus TaxID=10129 RepID=UPI0022442854|nr:spermatogenesis-associated protein 31D1-like [Apodemus sylvaticus]
MENILSSLSGLSKTWLTLGSASYHIDLNHTLLSGLGLLLLYIWYLIWRLLIQTLRRKKNAPKRQNSIRRHKRKAFKRKRTSQKDPEEGRKLQTILQSPGKPYDPTGFRQLLCPDPLCNVCNKASTQVSHLLSQAAPEDGAASVSSLPSKAPVTEALPSGRPGHPAPEAPPCTSPSIFSPNRIIPLDGVSPPIPLSASLSPQDTAPLNPAVLLAQTPRRTLASSPHLAPNATQEAQLALQAEVPQSPVESPRKRSPKVSTAKSTAYQPASSRPRFSAEDQPLSNLAQLPLESYATQSSDQRLTKAHAEEPGDHPSPSPDVLALFKKQEKGNADVTAYKFKKEKTVSFLMPPNTLAESSASRAALENSEVSNLSGSEKGKPGSPPLQQPPSHPKNPGDQSENKDVRLFWGLPSLHSESLKHEADNSGNSYPGRDSFNKMAKASTGSDASSLPYPTPLPLPESDQQGQILPQSQIKPNSLANYKAQTQPLIQFLPASQSQLRICGVRFHSLKDEAQPLTPSEIQQLEYNLLQKALQNFLGLPTLIQRFQEGFFPRPPKISSTRSSFKGHAPKTILPGDFPLSHPLERKLEHHLRKRLIQRRWGLPHRIRDSLSFMSPHSEIPEVPMPRSTHGLSWLSLYKFNANRNLPSFGVSQLGSFYRKPLEIHLLKEKHSKVQRQCPEIDQGDHLQGNSRGATKSSVHSNSETDPELQPGNMSGKFSKDSWVQGCLGKECETFLQEYPGKNTEEISGGEMLPAVGGSGHSMNTAQPPAETSPRQMAPSAGEEDALTKHPHNLVISDSKEKMLEKHITAFGRRMAFDLPQRVEESLESYLTKAEPSHPFPQQHVPGADSDKPSKLLQRNTTGDRTGTVHSVPTQQRPLPATSPVGHSQPASENKKVCVDKDLSTAPRGREPPQRWTDSMADKGVLQQSGSDNRPGPELPMSPGGPTHESLASSTHTQGSQGERESWEDGSVAEGSTQRHEGEQLPGPHPQSTQIVKGTQGLCSPGSHVTASQSLQGMPVPHSSETPDSKSQVSTEVLANSEGGTHIQVPATPLAPEEMTSKPQGPSSGDMTVSQVLHVHLPTVGISMESPQGPWVPAYVSGKRKNKDCPPGSRALPPLATEAGKLGGGDAGLGTSQSRGKGHCVQPRASEETQGHTSSPALTPRSQPLENQLTSQVKGFWQRLSPGRKHKGQEKSLARGCSPLTSVKGTSLTKGRCELCGNTESQKCGREPGTVLRRQLGYRHGTVIPCPQAPVSPLGSEKAQQEVQLQAQTEPVQRLPHLCCKASCSQVQRAESCSPGQGQTAPEGCGTTGKAKRVESSPVHASPPKSYLQESRWLGASGRPSLC